MTLATLLHHAALALAVAALGAAALRVAARAGARGMQLVVAAAPLGAGAAVAEALGLGLFGLGGSTIALLLAALATWMAVRALTPAAGVAGVLAAGWRGLSLPAAILLGAGAGIAAAWTAWLFLHPALGRDMELYHLPEAVAWVHGGHPGSIERIIVSVPVGNYPVTHEVLLEWGLALGRSFVWASLVTALMPVLVVAAAWTGLRTLGVGRAASLLAGTALAATPAVIASQNGGASLDPAALAWLLCCGALVAGVRERPGLLVPAFIAAALAIGTKTTAAPLSILLLAIGLWVARGRLRPLAWPLGGAAALAVAVGGVWYIRNLVTHGWPLWPFSSAPWGDPRPAIIANADVHFIDRPGATIDRLGSYYWHHFGGPLLVLAGALAAALLARSRAVGAAAAAAAVSVFIWMNAPFTGVLGVRAFDVGTGDATRYLLPGAAAAALAVALASRRGGLLGAACVALLAAATAIGVYETFDIGFPAAPAVATPVAGALLGAAAAATAFLLSRRPLRAPAVPWPSVAAVALALVAVLGAAAANGYVKRHGSTQTRESRVSAWFAAQPAWSDGSAPVASTWSLIGPLAGDRLQHPLVLLDARTACRRAAGGWLVVDLHEEQAARARSCGVQPGYSDSDFAAYAPPQLQGLAGGEAGRP